MPLFTPDPTYATLQTLPRKWRTRNWMPPGTSGPTAPPDIAFDALGGSAAGFTTSLSETHAIAGNAILAFLWMEVPGSSLPIPTITATVGGQAMTQLATTASYYNAPASHYVTVFGKLSPLTGSQTVAATLGSSCYTAMRSVSYSNVTSFGTPVTGNAANTSATITVSSATGKMVANAFASYLTTITAYNKTTRANVAPVGGTNLAGVVGDAAGASSVNFTATAGDGVWGGIGVPLI